TTTDENGNYIFTDLPNGDYTVTFGTPDGYNGPTISNVGNDGLDSDGQVVNVTINNADDMTIDSGFIKVSVGDTVWEDTDHDGQQDAGEPGIPGVTVTITYPDGTTETVVTDENGNYEFPNVPNGEVTIEFETPAGYTPTTSNSGDDTSDSDGTKVTITVDGKDDPTIDLGLVKEEPGTPSEPGTPDKGNLTSLPDTGEHNNSGALAALLAGLGGVLLYRRKK
ncbi:SdrD B-like domain-containing protein, partial [Macrococcoides caseolyticum]|uniref:SdrD B-like domain-containing protein n=1 Tax=Macrococcoides caseolyticum TaxID=69966 RepID=UPI001F44A0AF